MNDDRCDNIDGYDIAILSALAENADLTTIDLSNLVHLSRTAVARRIVNLRDKGVIGPAHVGIRYDKLGFEVRAFVEIKAPRFETFEMRDKVLARPEVLSVSMVVGEPLLVAEVITVDTNHLHQFLTWVSDLGVSSTRVVLRRHESPLSLKERLKCIEKIRREVDVRLVDSMAESTAS